MLALSGLTDVFKVIGILYLLLLVGAFALAIWLGYKKRWVWMTIVLVVFGYYPVKVNIQAYQRKQVYEAQKALFEKRCENAGVKIYKTVENVEGILLLKVRPKSNTRDWGDPMWPGAAFASEYGGETQIQLLLQYEHAPESFDTYAGKFVARPNDRGTFSAVKTNKPGYRFVDVKESDGKIYRYTLKTWQEPASWDKSKFLDKSQLIKEESGSGQIARYALTYDDDINPADRAQWVAGSTIKVLDTQTNETLATFTRYAADFGRGNGSGGRSPWLNAKVCGYAVQAMAGVESRYFVDQILKPIPIKTSN